MHLIISFNQLTLHFIQFVKRWNKICKPLLHGYLVK